MADIIGGKTTESIHNLQTVRSRIVRSVVCMGSILISRPKVVPVDPLFWEVFQRLTKTSFGHGFERFFYGRRSPLPGVYPLEAGKTMRLRETLPMLRLYLIGTGSQVSLKPWLGRQTRLCFLDGRPAKVDKKVYPILYYAGDARREKILPSGRPDTSVEFDR